MNLREGYDTWTIADIAQRPNKGQKMIVKLWCRLGQNADDRSPLVRLVVMRLPTGELLALACSSKPHRALAGYRQRWTIEPLFANLKTKGFNLEDMHITDPGKLSTLLAVLALTVTLCVKTGVAAAWLAPIPIKKHGRRAWSQGRTHRARSRCPAWSRFPNESISVVSESTAVIPAR